MLGNPRKRKAGRFALAAVAALLLLPAQASFAQAIEGDGTEPAIPHEAIPAPAPAPAPTTGPALMMPTPTLVEPEAPRPEAPAFQRRRTRQARPGTPRHPSPPARI